MTPPTWPWGPFASSLCVGAFLAAAAACSVTGPLGTTATVGMEAGGASSSGGGASTVQDAGASSVPSTSDASSSPPAADAGPPPVMATFRTLDTSQYLSDGDGGALTATSDVAGPSQTFALTDLNGGSLASGDPIYLASNSGVYLSAADGGGGALSFSVTSPGADETFVLVLVDAGAGSPIGAGDQVALQTQGTGNYVSAINGGGGEVLANAPWDRAWETYTFGITGGGSASDAGATGAVDSGPSSASAARATVLAFLAQISGNHTAIGVEDKSGGEADSDQMASMAGNGQSPSFWSADWGFGCAAQPSSREAIVQEGEKQWGEGAIVQYIYHACPLSWGSNEEGCTYDCESNPCTTDACTNPIDGSFGDLTDAQWTDLTTSGGMLNGVWLARLDTLATYFQELKDAGVAPLFRPFHEINGNWAWWQGRPGPTGSALLYQITHDYLVNTKGLDNIIWVWNVQDYTTLASDVPVYTPGTSYFDVAALDVYNTGYTSGNYNAMIGGSGGKPIGIAECATMPDPSLLAQQPLWAYVAVWPDYLYAPYQNNNSTQIPELFADPQVLTLSQMPGW